MAEEHFSDFVARERDRLGAERKAVVTQQRELQAKLAEIDREFQAIYQTKRVSCLYPADAAQRPHSRRRGRLRGARVRLGHASAEIPNRGRPEPLTNR